MLETKEYRTMDKSAWEPGPWNDEPDKKQWEDPTTGLPCLIVRNSLGNLCGYVGVFENHPFYGKDYDDVDVNVHGGLTFDGFCSLKEDEASSICHVSSDPRKVYWFGFDCDHAWDISPGMMAKERSYGFTVTQMPDTTYKDFAYVTKEVESLAIQLKELEEKKP